MLCMSQFKWVFKTVPLMILASALFSTTLFAVDLECSSQKDAANLNEVYNLGTTNFLEIKVFDPQNTDYSNWQVLFCDNNANLDQCTLSTDVSSMLQSNLYWFYKYVDDLDQINSPNQFTLLLVDNSGDLIDMLSFNGATLGAETNVMCSVDYSTVVTTSKSKGVMRTPDGTGPWDNSSLQGAKTESTPGDSNEDGENFSYSISEHRLDECIWDGSVSDVLDTTFNAFHGTSQPGASSVVNMGGGINSNGYFTNGYIAIPDLAHLTSSRTITAWFRTTDRTKPNQRIFADDEDNSDGSYAVSVGDTGAGKVSFLIRGLSTVSLDTDAVVQNDTWYFVAATFNKTSMIKKLYIYDGSGTLLSEVQQSVSGTLGIPTGVASIGGESGGNRFTGYLDEVKLFIGSLSKSSIEMILTNEIVGNNYDGSTRNPINCNVYVAKNGNYTAVDSVVGEACHAGLHWDNLLQTKIVNDDISLSILALEEGTTPPLPMEANITKVSLVHYPSGNNNACTGTALSVVDVCTNCGLTDVNGCLALNIDKSFNQRASRCVEIVIQGKDKDDTTGSSLSDSNSSDNLAIRPNTYNCDGMSSGVLISEHTYASTFDAMPLNLTTPTLGYTTNTVNIRANKYTRLGDLNSSLSGIFSPSTLNFLDGNANANLYFNDVGDVGIDINDSVWADVDSDDTAEVDRVIHTECRRLFRPDHFEVILNKPLLENNSTFTYLSNDLNMSAWIRNLDITVTAQGEANGVMQNYTYPINTFFANQITLSPSLSLPFYYASAVLDSTVSDENSTDISGFEFINGIATHSYEDMRFNYPRDFSFPVSPFRVDGNLTNFSLQVYDNVYPSVIGTGSSDADGNATFYYGRLHPNDLVTSIIPQTNSIPFEVYDETGSSFVLGMTQTGLSWYLNRLHTNNSMGDIVEASASSSTIVNNLAGFNFSYAPVDIGQQDLVITAVGSQENTVIHLKTQEWLWYVPAGFGSAYDESAGSDCTMHPCFKLSITPVNTPSIIQSGSFEGAQVPDVNRSDYFKKGIKLFR